MPLPHAEPYLEAEPRQPIAERLSKMVVVCSTATAVGVTLYMASGTVRELPVYGAIAFGLAVLGARLQTGATTRLIVFTCYLAPTLITLAVGPPYLAAYFMVWLAALLGLIVGSSDVTRWHLGPALRIALALWTLILATAWPLVALREFDFAPSAIMSWSVGLEPKLATMGVGNTAAIQLVALLSIDWMVGRYSERRDQSFEREILLPLGIGCLVSIALAIYQGTVDIFFLNSAAFSTVGRASGTLRDANPYGVLAALWGPAGIALLLALGITAWMAQVLVLVISWFGLWVSGSRNALALGVVGTAVVIWQLWPALSHPRRNRLALVLGAIGAASVVFVRLLHGSTMSPVARFRQIFPAATIAAGGVTGLLSRLWDPYAYGLIAGRMIADFPWFGVGVGTFSLLAGDYGRSAGYMGITYDNAQNWFRHQFVEFGVFGSLGWIVWTLLFAYLLIAGRSKDGSTRSVTKIVRLLPVMFVLVSLVGMPTMSAPAAVTFAIFAAWYLLLVDSSALDSPLCWKIAGHSSVWLAMWAVVAIFAAGTAYAARHELRGAARAAEFDWPYSYGFYEPESGPAGEYRWVGRRGVIVLQAPKPWMRLTISLDPVDGDLRLESLLRNAVLRKPLDVRVWRDGEEVLATALHSTNPVTEYVRIPAGRKRIVLETQVNRVLRPADFGLKESRELGVSVAWDFVDSSR
jgi:hypothetical protein